MSQHSLKVTAVQQKVPPKPLWTISLLEAMAHEPVEVIQYFETSDKMDIYLERGNSQSGLIHIMDRHGDQFKDKFSVEETEDGISNFIRETLTSGPYTFYGYTLKQSKKIQDKQTLALIYQLDVGKFLRVAIGTNGFIVSAVPQSYNNDVKKSQYI